MDFPQASIVPGEPRASSALDAPSSPESQAAEHTKQLRTELFASTADWQSETKLAAALSMLQDLDAKVYYLSKPFSPLKTTNFYRLAFRFLNFAL